MSRIAVVGTGYVGLVSGALLSDFGHNVICVDLVEEKIEKLKKGTIPIFEPGLAEVVERNAHYRRLSFTTAMKQAVGDSEIIFIAVGTPPRDDGSADLQYVLQAAADIAAHMESYKVIVNKSTVPVGTGKLVRRQVQEILEKRHCELEFDVVSNPEFLREGSAVNDFSRPDRVIIGTESAKALEKMKEVYRVLYLNETPFIETNLETAEMIKYASNAFLAMKITYINEIANLCEKVGANVQQVAKAMGRDGRISPKFLHAGPGYGGSCFPKDTQALAQIAREHGECVSLIEATVAANDRQKIKMVDKIQGAMGAVNGKTIAVLGLTFKPNTDDMREAPALTILPALAEAGAALRVHDPEGEKEGRWRLEAIGDSITFCSDEYEAIQGSEAIVLLTEWNAFRNLDFKQIHRISEANYFFDLRNVYDRAYIEKEGFQYFGVGV